MHARAPFVMIAQAHNRLLLFMKPKARVRLRLIEILCQIPAASVIVRYFQVNTILRGDLLFCPEQELPLFHIIIWANGSLWLARRP